MGGCRSDPGEKSGAVISIFLWQQNRSYAPVCFRDDPEPGAITHSIGRQNPPAVLEGEFVFAAVVLVYVSPVTR